jgi:UPF0716 protein FxsA
MRGLSFLILLLPVAELLLLIEVGAEFGGLATLGLLAAGVVVGLSILRGRGLANLASARRRFGANEQPGQELVESMLLAAGGLLLLIPGFITDAFSLPLLLPWTRRALARRLLHSGNFQAFGGTGGAGFTVFRAGARSQTRSWEGGEIVEGEVLRDADPDSRLKGPREL